MVKFEVIASSVTTGLLLGIGLWVFADGIIASQDNFEWSHIIPVMLSFLSIICINMMSPDRIEESGPIKIWLFFFVTLAMIAVGVSIWITTNDYTADDNYTGVTLIIQSTLTFIAGMIYFIGKKEDNDLFN